MKKMNRMFLALAFAGIMFGQSEALDPSQGAAATVGRGRPMVEAVGASSQPGKSDQAARFAEVSQWVKTVQPGVDAVQQRVAQLAEEFPGLNPVNVTARHADGTVFYSDTVHNLRTNAGANWQADIMANTSTPSVNTQCNYIAVTNDATSPVATGTTLTSEIATNGLTRAQGTYAHTSNATSYTVAKTFTASGTQASQQSALFTASSGGTMCFWNTYTAVTVNNTDTLTITWTINF